MGKTQIPDDFAVSAEMRDWARVKFPSIDIDAQTEEFCDYWRAHGKKMADWVATWRNWIRRCPQFAPKTAPATRWRPLTAQPPKTETERQSQAAYERRMQRANEDSARRFDMPVRKQ